ncbi:methylated-DNA--[protein]-cysteine S-methyltransferase [Legionella sp. MW5194]|uniref:methylated-DNA--[protein]-cysteine S-methyltransferase n=1 Tax=Legionella sp. MW5194 TaxID=2662448 RepID=UPI00193EA55C|nr:methylated-DNA--[protein]-cysteine S-methyltransferase [Legionella sp. MW5194]QRN04765.1 methylated-DNA--[protein]-cysteine S-methyltransferase [Legionella sp. MW5194]
MLSLTAYQTPVGWLNVRYDEHFVFGAVFSHTPFDNAAPTTTPLCLTIARELDHYFSDPHYRFQLPLKPLGTPYQQRVWNALLVIPVGRTVTYGELANTLQSSPRAIGQACKSNPLALFIPCHRVVGKDNPGGYMGHANALSYKHDLLSHEGYN